MVPPFFLDVLWAICMMVTSRVVRRINDGDRAMLRRDVRLVFTPAYEVTKHSNGATLLDRFTGREVYLQPGDDESLFLQELEALEINEADTEENCNNLVSPYFDGVENNA